MKKSSHDQEIETRAEVFAHVRDLFGKRHRLIFSASGNTPYMASSEMIRNFRDAGQEHGPL